MSGSHFASVSTNDRLVNKSGQIPRKTVKRSEHAGLLTTSIDELMLIIELVVVQGSIRGRM
jgi:hypothetical protein